MFIAKAIINLCRNRCVANSLGPPASYDVRPAGQVYQPYQHRRIRDVHASYDLNCDVIVGAQLFGGLELQLGAFLLCQDGSRGDGNDVLGGGGHGEGRSKL